MIKENYLDIEKNITTIPLLKTKTTFEEFVLYLIDSYDKDEFKNVEKYWGSYKEFWNIFYAEFGYIDNYQSLFDHSRNILSLLNVENGIKFAKNWINIYIRKYRKRKLEYWSIKMASEKNILELYEV